MIVKMLKNYIKTTLTYGVPKESDGELLRLIDIANKSGSVTLHTILNDYLRALNDKDYISAMCKLSALHFYCYGGNLA